MMNNNNRWPSPALAYTGSSPGEQSQPESGVRRKNGSDRGDSGSHEDGGGRRDGRGRQNRIGRRDGILDGMCIEDSVIFLKREENDCVFMFLVGLNKDLDEVRGGVLSKIPSPTLRKTFAEIRREEVQQEIMMGKTPQSSKYESSALANRNLDEGKRSYKVPWCDHCKREWHTSETC
ncbi:hypothetical protein KIW84_022247 [Lathyrus oleraceus]|uniref:Uncharacterized protein n=1 Tax=Pisum sativum TaxID=3888 RepID=A0A9D4Y9Z7_PEA|nr:hypothetical protein KIW84_022247 [Pisum sativum]